MCFVLTLQDAADPSVSALLDALNKAGLGVDMSTGAVMCDAVFISWCDAMANGFDEDTLKALQYYGPKR
jgi:hypothetical protein